MVASSRILGFFCYFFALLFLCIASSEHNHYSSLTSRSFRSLQQRNHRTLSRSVSRRSTFNGNLYSSTDTATARRPSPGPSDKVGAQRPKQPAKQVPARPPTPPKKPAPYSTSESPAPPHPPLAPPRLSAPPQENDLSQLFLNAHNTFREKYSAPSLRWSPSLVEAAKAATNTCFFRHTPNNPYGENIAAGQADPSQVVSEWVEGPNEKSSYNPSSPEVSHFTQVVWSSTVEVGCALTSCAHMGGVSLPQSPIKFWACEYNPPGNVGGQYQKNVHAGPGGNPQALSDGQSYSNPSNSYSSPPDSYSNGFNSYASP